MVLVGALVAALESCAFHRHQQATVPEVPALHSDMLVSAPMANEAAIIVGGAVTEDPFGLPVDPDFERRWAELCNTICMECREPLSEHYYHADCATERGISEELGKATAAFLEGMAEPARDASEPAPKNPNETHD